ncbi:hypothetical protein BaRGS_00020712 [Batillaria attramentaria]|uniref:Uncharacterized protein n=1 Tax=Batillaria attramentaria TaxID=370345 RepID=A0ABD0KMG6_9CAEN
MQARNRHFQNSHFFLSHLSKPQTSLRRYCLHISKQAVKSYSQPQRPQRNTTPLAICNIFFSSPRPLLSATAATSFADWPSQCGDGKKLAARSERDARARTRPSRALTLWLLQAGLSVGE